MRPLRVSVVVPTYRRPELLARCLRALVQQDFPKDDFEILIADDAHELPEGATTWNQVESWAAKSGVRIAYVGVVGRHGPAAARNRGWRQARGGIIAFTDDDTIPDRQWLSSGIQAFEQMKKDIAGCECRPLAMAGRTIVPISEEPTDYELNESGLGRAEFITANCFIERDALVAIGGFDEMFTMAWREDSDLHFRLLQLGGGEGAIGRADDAIVVHPVRPAPFAVALRQARKVLFNALLYKKHPEFYRGRIQSRPPLRYYAMLGCLVVAIGAGLAGLWPLTGAALMLWLCLVLRFAHLRLKRTSKRPLHVWEMLVTSALLAPVAIYWRLYGAWKFRVAFL